MIETALFEKIRRYGLLVAIGATVVLLVLKVLETGGAFETSSYSYDYFSDSYGGPNFWSKTESIFWYIVGFSWAIILMVLFVIPRKKNDKD